MTIEVKNDFVYAEFERQRLELQELKDAELTAEMFLAYMLDIRRQALGLTDNQILAEHAKELLDIDGIEPEGTVE